MSCHTGMDLHGLAWTCMDSPNRGNLGPAALRCVPKGYSICSIVFWHAPMPISTTGRPNCASSVFDVRRDERKGSTTTRHATSRVPASTQPPQRVPPDPSISASCKQHVCARGAAQAPLTSRSTRMWRKTAPRPRRHAVAAFSRLHRHPRSRRGPWTTTRPLRATLPSASQALPPARPPRPPGPLPTSRASPQDSAAG